METITTTTTWTKEHEEAARAQGWGIFAVLGCADCRPFHLERIDEAGAFGSDPEAWEFVRTNAHEHDCATARAALEFLKEHAPEEYRDVIGLPVFVPTSN